MKKVILNVIFRWTIVLGSFLLSSHCFSQLNEYSFQEIEKLQKEDPKNTVVFIHTNWCSYCAMMNKTVFNNKKIIKLLNDKFYYVPLDGEEKNDIIFYGKTFKFKPNGYKTGEHELALALGAIDGKISYPTLVILNAQNEIIFQYGGYIDASTMIEILSKL